MDDPRAFNHRFTEINGLRMHYVEEGEGPLVVLLHGYPFLWYLWRHQIRPLAAAGYRVVAPDQRGYGQTEGDGEVESSDITHLVGDVVGLINAVGGESAVVIGQDWGSPIAYHAALMRPDLVRGVLMMCSPPGARSPVRPSEVTKAFAEHGLEFYQTYFSQPRAADEIMSDVRRFLLGTYYSTSGSCPDDQQWRWAWKSSETFADTYAVPENLPSHLSARALDHYVDEFARTGIKAANNWYAALDRSWENTSFLDGATVKQPSLFLSGDRDPSLRPLFGIDRQGPALAALGAHFLDLRKVIAMPGVGHSPPEERPDEVTAIVLEFLRDVDSKTEGGRSNVEFRRGSR